MVVCIVTSQTSLLTSTRAVAASSKSRHGGVHCNNSTSLYSPNCSSQLTLEGLPPAWPGTHSLIHTLLVLRACLPFCVQVSFYMRKGADLLSKWVGEAEKQLRLLFEEAARNQPAIIFFDEIDGLAPVSVCCKPRRLCWYMSYIEPCRTSGGQWQPRLQACPSSCSRVDLSLQASLA